jgi:cell division protein FtsB
MNMHSQSARRLLVRAWVLILALATVVLAFKVRQQSQQIANQEARIDQLVLENEEHIRREALINQGFVRTLENSKAAVKRYEEFLEKSKKEDQP